MRAGVLVVLGLLAAACNEAPPVVRPPPDAPASLTGSAASLAGSTSPRPASAPTTVTLLFTSDEHGWILPTPDKDGALRGGAAELLGQLTTREGHCVPAEKCPDPGTLLLSGGDNFTGPAISTYFSGEPLAEAMARMGYAASAFGNHEFDFGRERFLENRKRSGVMYLGANVHATDPALKPDMDLPAFTIFERHGIKIGVIGLAPETTLTSAMASRFAGVAIDKEEPALAAAVPKAWAAGPDALVLIAHECPDKLKPMLDQHPDWGFSFVGGGHCHKMIKAELASGAPLYAPGWRFESYARAKLVVDRSRPPKSRVVSVEPALIEVSHKEGDGAPVDAEIARAAAGWKAKLDKALGEEIGYASAGLDKDSPTLARWITEAMRSELKTDVAIVNTGGIRQSLPKGPITKASVWSILPFDNKMLICDLLGSDLVADLETKEATYAGVTRVGDGYRMADGKKLDPARRYRVATIDFLYFGGAHFPFQKQDPAPKETNVDWRDPIIFWTQKQRTTSADPLEKRLGAPP